MRSITTEKVINPKVADQYKKLCSTCRSEEFLAITQEKESR